MRPLAVNKVCEYVSYLADEVANGFFDEIRGMLQTFGGVAKRSYLLAFTIEDGFSVPRFGVSFFQTRRNSYG